MNAVGIDVSKGKSTVTIRRPGDVVIMPPCDIPHTQSAINCLICFIIIEKGPQRTITFPKNGIAQRILFYHTTGLRRYRDGIPCSARFNATSA